MPISSESAQHPVADSLIQLVGIIFEVFCIFNLLIVALTTPNDKLTLSQKRSPLVLRGVCNHVKYCQTIYDIYPKHLPPLPLVIFIALSNLLSITTLLSRKI